MEVGVRHQKTPLCHYDVISYSGVSKLIYFVEHDIGYQLSKCQCSILSGLNFTENPDPTLVLRRDRVKRILLNSYNGRVARHQGEVRMQEPHVTMHSESFLAGTK